MKRIGIIGYGAIGAWIAGAIARDDRFELGAICARKRQIDMAMAQSPTETIVTADVEAFLDAGLDIVVEAAGQESVVTCGRQILERGCDFYVLSTGALADPVLRKDLSRTARSSGGRIGIPAGALAGFRGLMTLRHGGLSAVHYTSIKPPTAWEGTPAAERFDLGRLAEAQIVFEGNAAEAALSFPANANLAAAVAIAGIGFERTRVTLVADPGTDLNIGRLEATSDVASMTLKMSGNPFATNPKSSRITALSVLATLENDADDICFV